MIKEIRPLVQRELVDKISEREIWTRGKVIKLILEYQSMLLELLAEKNNPNTNEQ